MCRKATDAKPSELEGGTGDGNVIMCFIEHLHNRVLNLLKPFKSYYTKAVTHQNDFKSSASILAIITLKWPL